jgi:hypothetical protein
MKFSNSDRDQFKKEVDLYLGRIVEARVTAVDCVKLWERSWTPNYTKAVRALRLLARQSERKNEDAFLVKVDTAWLPIDAYGAMYSLKLYSPIGYPLVHFIHPTPVRLDQLTDTHDEAVAMEEWLRTAGETKQRILRAKDTLDKVFDTANTPGQVFRMVPDLMKYLDPRHVQRAREQLRRSQLPYEWSLMDKSPVRDACDLLAMAHLLPPGATTTNRLNNCTWPNLIAPENDKYFTLENAWQVPIT